MPLLLCFTYNLLNVTFVIVFFIIIIVANSKQFCKKKLFSLKYIHNYISIINNNNNTYRELQFWIKSDLLKNEWCTLHWFFLLHFAFIFLLQWCNDEIENINVCIKRLRLSICSERNYYVDLDDYFGQFNVNWLFLF